MRRFRWGEIAHVFIGAALALPPVFLAWAFGSAMTGSRPGALNRWALVVLAVLAVVVIALVAGSPPVRPVEVGAARDLLDLDLPNPVDTRGWGPRLLGASWLAIVAVVGLVVAAFVLYTLPLGVGLLTFPFSEESAFELVGRRWEVGRGAWWLAPLGAAAIAAALASLPIGGRLLRRWAPPFLGPSDADRLAREGARRVRLARANQLARELHDSIGHRLTAITVQADAAERLADRDPEAAAHSARAIGDASRAALEELDEVLGALRRGGDAPEVGPDLEAVLADASRSLRLVVDGDADVPSPDRPAVAGILREALANATRHGAGSAVVSLTVDRCGVTAVVRNPRRPDVLRPSTGTGSSGGGRGIDGMRERALLAGGDLAAGERDGEWVVTLRLPRRVDG